MQALIIAIMLMVVLLIQSFLPIKCDLLLVSIIILSERKNAVESLSFSFFGGFVADALVGFGFVNTLSKTLAGLMANLLKPLMAWEGVSLAFLMTVILTPIVYLVELFIYWFFYHQTFSFMLNFWSIIKLLIANSIAVPFLYWYWDRNKSRD